MLVTGKGVWNSCKLARTYILDSNRVVAINRPRIKVEGAGYRFLGRIDCSYIYSTGSGRYCTHGQENIATVSKLLCIILGRYQAAINIVGPDRKSRRIRISVYGYRKHHLL